MGRIRTKARPIDEKKGVNDKKEKLKETMLKADKTLYKVVYMPDRPEESNISAVNISFVFVEKCPENERFLNAVERVDKQLHGESDVPPVIDGNDRKIMLMKGEHSQDFVNGIKAVCSLTKEVNYEGEDDQSLVCKEFKDIKVDYEKLEAYAENKENEAPDFMRF